MSSYLLYGVNCTSIDQARIELEDLLESCLEERESAYQGGLYYAFGKGGSEQFILKKNIDPFDGEPAEQKFPDYQFVLYINATERASELITLLSKKVSFTLLRHEVF